MLKVLIGIALLWLTIKLARYMRAITPVYNRPELFRNPLAFTALNILMIALPILALWFLLAGIFNFAAPFSMG